MNRMSSIKRAVGLVLGLLALSLMFGGVAHAQSLPPFPVIYAGAATVGGQPVPDGAMVYAMVGDYVSVEIAVKNGKYNGLAVGPPDESYSGRQITFHLSEDVVADQTDNFVFTQGPTNQSFKQGFNLSFPHLPTPSPTPTNTPVPTAVPTNTSVPTATPEIARPTIYSGSIVIAGANVPAGGRLTARVGSYESLPALVEGATFQNLVIAPDDRALVGQTIEFYLNGVKAATTDRYDNGAVKTNFVVAFTNFPSPTPAPTETPAPTATPRPTVAPTATNVPPTLTPTPTVEPSPTRIPTQTPVPATPTLVPPTPTQAPAAATPTATPEASGGTCSSAAGVPLSAGLGNLLLLLAPMGLILGMKRYRRRW